MHQARATNPPGTGPYVVGFDMDPFSVGEGGLYTCANCSDGVDNDADTLIDGADPDCLPNGASNVGYVDPCVDMPNVPGYTFDVDVFLDAVPPDETLDGFNYAISDTTGFAIAPGGPFILTAQDHSLLLMATPGSGPLTSLSEAVPEPPDSAGNPGIHVVSESDPGASEPGGSVGVLGGYTFSLNPGAASGIYALTLSNLALAGSGANPDWAFRVTDILDGSYSPVYGMIAVGTFCPTSQLDLQHVSLDVVYGEDWAGDSATCADTLDNGGDTLADAADPDCQLADGHVPVAADAQFILRESLRNNGPIDGLIAKVTTTCTAPPDGLCSYHVKDGDSPDGDLEVSVDGGPPEVNPSPGTLFEGDTITVVQRIHLPLCPTVSLDKDWGLRRLAGGTHTWEFQSTVEPDDPFVPETYPHNDSASASITAYTNTDATDQDGDTLLDEDPLDGIDNDGDTLVDEDPVGDGAFDPGDPDDDNDGYWDDDETDKGSDPPDGVSTPEHCDGLDNDGDTLIDEGFPDSDGDTVKDCVDPDHPYYTDDDDDGDGFTDEQEQWMSTDELDACNDTSNPWDAPMDDAWPPDTDRDGDIDIIDVLKLKCCILTSPGDVYYNSRLDFDADTDVDIVDVLRFKPFIMTSCSP